MVKKNPNFCCVKSTETHWEASKPGAKRGYLARDEEGGQGRTGLETAREVTHGFLVLPTRREEKPRGSSAS